MSRVAPSLRLLCALALCAAGCVTNQGTAQAMFSKQYDCPEDKVDYETVGGYTALLVRGCGREQMYACQRGTCVREGEPKSIGGAEPAK